MSLTPLFDVESLDLSPVADRSAIGQWNPHRGAFALLDEVLYISEDNSRVVARIDVRADAFWTSGHIPGKPIMPGVLMIEAGAQAAGVLYYRKTPHPELFAGFTRIEDTSFRGMVVPGDELLILVQEIKYSPKRFVSVAQGLVRGEIVFQSRISGMAFPQLGAITRAVVDPVGQA